MNLSIGIIQHHSKVGSILANINKIRTSFLQAIEQKPNLHLCIVGELAISGYSPLDEFYNKDYLTKLKIAIKELAKITLNTETILIFGEVFQENDNLYNALYVAQSGEVIKVIKKQKLVNYDIFNESRYFNKGYFVDNIIEVNGYKLACVVCEDLWHEDIILSLKEKDISGLISINASPYYKNKLETRLKVAYYAVKSLKVPVIYVNIVGGVDGVIFDGQSFVMKENLELNILPFVEEATGFFELTENKKIINLSNNFLSKHISNKNYTYDPTSNLKLTNNISKEFYEAIQVSFKDFIEDNGFKGVIIGVSGGIDSALSVAIASDTLGSDKVIAVSMPSLYTSELSKEIIKELVINLNFKFYEIPIDSIIESYNTQLFLKNNLFADIDNKVTKENLQSRVRGNILMAMSNSLSKYIVLCNGNKSELATGYFTLYGDSCGAFNLLKDLYKTEVFALANWRNQNISKFSKVKKLNIIPERCINRAPSAELAYNQTDETELLDYPLLDAILYDIIESNLSYSSLVNKYLPTNVNKVISLIKSTEYKRKQGVVGVKLKKRSFGKEWQYPITNGFR